MKRILLLLLPFALALPACTATQQGAAIGGAAGAAGGYMIGRKSGHKTAWTVGGAAAGAVLGGVVGHEVGKVKYCPICGRGFQKEDQYCPNDGAALQWKK